VVFCHRQKVSVNSLESRRICPILQVSAMGPTGDNDMINQPRFIAQGEAEWDRAWMALPRSPLTSCPDPDCPCCEDPETGETWQYMGTYGDQHSFRHRNFPGYGRLTIEIPATPGW
jgi:hypothetical protein